MKQLAILFFFSCLICCAVAQEPYAKAYAKRKIMGADKNRNGQLEKTEVKNRWEQLKAFDTDGNEVVTIAEYSKIEIPYLETQGERKLNLMYKTTMEEDLFLDIYYPRKRNENNIYPILLYVHGGGWAAGSKENITKGLKKEPFLKLLEQGFAVVSVNYRLTRHKKVVMRDCLVDVMDAVRYLSKHNKKLKLNANSVYVLGDSAGGHLAQMLTLANPAKFLGDEELYKYNYKIAAGVSWYGPSDFTKMELFATGDSSKKTDRFYDRIMKPGADAALKDSMYKEISPVFYLSKNSPPLYMMAADNDTTIPVAHAYRMKNSADSIGAPVELFIVKNAGHNWRKAGGEVEPSKEVIVQKTIDFFLRYK